MSPKRRPTRPVTDTELLCRAGWIRLQAVGLIAQAGLGHYSSTFSSAEIFSSRRKVTP